MTLLVCSILAGCSSKDSVNSDCAATDKACQDASNLANKGVAGCDTSVGDDPAAAADKCATKPTTTSKAPAPTYDWLDVHALNATMDGATVSMRVDLGATPQATATQTYEFTALYSFVKDANGNVRYVGYTARYNGTLYAYMDVKESSGEPWQATDLQDAAVAVDGHSLRVTFQRHDPSAPATATGAQAAYKVVARLGSCYWSWKGIETTAPDEHHC